MKIATIGAVGVMGVGISAYTIPFSIALAQSTAQPVSGASLNAPESPAAVIVGASTQGITSPSSPSALGASLLNGVDITGQYKTGLDIDFVPALLIGTAGHDSWATAQTYRSNPIIRFFDRLSLSVATAKGASSADNSVAIGLGLRSVLFDAGDPVMDSGQDGTLDSCLTQAIKDGNNIEAVLGKSGVVTPGKPLPGAAEGLAAQQAEEKNCRTNVASRLWNRSAIDVAGATSFFSSDGSYDNLVQQTYAIYSTVAYGFDGFQSVTPNEYASSNWLQRNAQLLFGIQYLNGQEVASVTESGIFYAQNAFQAGGAIRLKHLFGGDDTALTSAESPTAASADDRPFSFANTLFSLSVVYQSNEPVSLPHSDNLVFTVATELKLSDSIYFDFGIGENKNDTNGATNGFALTQLKYNVNSVSSLFD